MKTHPSINAIDMLTRCAQVLNSPDVGQAERSEAAKQATAAALGLASMVSFEEQMTLRQAFDMLAPNSDPFQIYSTYSIKETACSRK